jgi:predicted transcriptional regulator
MVQIAPFGGSMDDLDLRVSRRRLVRLREDVNAELERLAAQRGTTVSALVREAVMAYFFSTNGANGTIREAVPA